MDEMGLLQIKIYTRKFFRTLKRESIISIIMGFIITLLVMFVTNKNMYDTFEGTKSGLFSLICVCIWIGIFNSIQLVCREKNDIVKDELDKSLHATSYMAAHFIYQSILCAIQSLVVFVVFLSFMLVGGKDIGFPLWYLITIFLVMLASDAMAFVISSIVPNPIVAMTVMPLLLLIQLVMAGVLFELKDMSAIVANFTISKWGMMAFGTIGEITKCETKVQQMIDMDKLPPGMKLKDLGIKNNGIPDTDMDAYGGDFAQVILCWLIFIAFIALFYFLSVWALKATTKRIKK